MHSLDGAGVAQGMEATTAEMTELKSIVSTIISLEEEIADNLRSKIGGRLRSTSVSGHGDNLPTCNAIKKEVGDNHLPESCGLGASPFGAGICICENY